MRQLILRVFLAIAYTIASAFGVSLPILGNRLRSFVLRFAAFTGWRPGGANVRYVDAGGHSLRMAIVDRGSPTVVFEGGGTPEGGSSLEAWNRVLREVSGFASTVAYDRAGTGLSPTGPRPRHARQIAGELRRALANAGMSPPYILVGSSFGGLLVRVFAGMFPSDIGGMLLLDPTPEDEFESGDWPTFRLDGGGIAEDIRASLEQARESLVPEGVPVALVTSSVDHALALFRSQRQRERASAYVAAHRAWHARWVASIPGASHIVAEGCGHHIALEAPDLVVRILRQMVGEASLRREPR